jgi:hypothetical protein
MVAVKPRNSDFCTSVGNYRDFRHGTRQEGKFTVICQSHLYDCREILIANVDTSVIPIEPCPSSSRSADTCCNLNLLRSGRSGKHEVGVR